MSSEERGIDSAMAMLEQCMRRVQKLSRGVDIQIDICSMLTDDPDLIVEWANIGDYEVHLEGNKITWNYRPKVLKGGGYDTSLYQDDIDPSRIVSFTMPPEEQP